MRIHTTQLHSLEFLFQDRERQLKQIMGDLQINTIKDETSFTATVNRIKSQILLTPASIGDPKIENNRQEARPTFEDPMFFGRDRTVNIVTVTFPVVGSHELFKYRANGGSFTITNVYSPDYSSISIDLEVPALDKEQVLAAAAKEMEATRKLIAQNNPQVEAWSQRLTLQIDALAAQKRQELVNLYS